MGLLDNLFICDLNGKTLTFNQVDSATTIRQLQALICDRNGIPATEQRLIYAGKELNRPDSTLDDYAIVNESTLHLVLRLVGGATSQAVGDAQSELGEPMMKKLKPAATSSSLPVFGSHWDAEYKGDWYEVVVLRVTDKAVVVNFLSERAITSLPLSPYPLLPLNSKPRTSLGSFLDCFDKWGKWYEAKVIKWKPSSVKVHYVGWGDNYDEWISKTSIRLAPWNSKTNKSSKLNPTHKEPEKEDGKVDEKPVPKPAEVVAPVVVIPTKVLTAEIAAAAGVQLAAKNETCMIKLEANEKEPRALMPCKHAITPEGLAALANSMVDLKRSWEIRCVSVDNENPKETCNQVWPWAMVRTLAMFDVVGEKEEKKKLETKLSVNLISQKLNGKQCPHPDCKNWILPDVVPRQKVECPACRVHHRSPSHFCWQCNQVWKSNSSSIEWCGNVSCLNAKRSALLALDSSPLVTVGGLSGFSFPSIRACPHCLQSTTVGGMLVPGKIRLVEHSGGGHCKHLTHTGPGGCQKSFCGGCLGFGPVAPSTVWACGGAFSPCLLTGAAPKQNETTLGNATLV